MDKLEPCPWPGCKKKPKVWWSSDKTIWGVSCSGNPHGLNYTHYIKSGTADTKEEAIKIWNRRKEE